MAIIRHTAAPLRAVRCLRQPVATRSFSVTARRQGGGAQFEPPSGWLWGIKPGEKPEPEGWEWPMYLFCGSLLVATAAIAFKPDTRLVFVDTDIRSMRTTIWDGGVKCMQPNRQHSIELDPVDGLA